MMAQHWHENHDSGHQAHAGAAKAPAAVHPGIGSPEQAPEPKSAWRMTIEDGSGIPFVIDCFAEERTKAAQEAIAGYQLWRPEHNRGFGVDYIITSTVELQR